MEGIEMRISFWPSGIIGAKAKCVSALVDSAELAGFCVDSKAHCPMGCFSCPFGDKKCKDIVKEDWDKYFLSDTSTNEVASSEDKKGSA